MAADDVRKWRIKVKNLFILALGGRCNKCSYDTCTRAMDFHHINENDKLFSITDALIKKKKFDNQL